MRGCGMAKDIEVGERLAAWREHCGISQTDAGAAAGMSKQSVSFIENGAHDITVGKLNLICKRAFGTTLHEFFGPLP